MNTSEMFEGENSSLRKTFESVITPDTEMVEDAFKCFHKSNMGWHILTPEMMGKQPTIDDFINTAKQTTLKLLSSRDTYWKERIEEERERICDAIDDYFISPNPIPDTKILCGYIKETLEDNLK